MSEPPRRAEFGCAALLAAIVPGVAATAACTLGRSDDLGTFRFAQAWLVLLVGGGVGPAVALATVARRSRRALIVTTLWMLVVLLACAGLAINSGGGV